jgi:hypothetical protein
VVNFARILRVVRPAALIFLAFIFTYLVLKSSARNNLLPVQLSVPDHIL